MTKLLRSFGLLAVLAAIAIVPTASAGNGTSDCTYHPENCKAIVKGAKAVSNSTQPTTTVATAESGGLPFTGTDLTVLLAGGAVFGLVGFGIRRSGRDRRG